MGHTLETFAAACHDILKAEPGPSGRRKVCELLQQALNDEGFVAAQITAATPERQILYEDPELGFCILAHAYRGAKDSPPHDHGPSWAIYGQASGETEMTDWDLLQPATESTPGKARPVRSYRLQPGAVHLYNEGDLHSPSRSQPTALIRIEGRDMMKVRRLRYQAV
jgi:predicted metal-dependent enzyme (double-stranded beta helix superfamily)